ncbi:MAG: hypothetical protein EPO32_01015 [Anaerolineae bacterium]|nr:MAG: hypothetical protein EPO32_01015 [Anaerolineae bacterium]
MDFGKVLTRAGEIIWKHKILWIFGILAGCGAQGGNSSYQYGSNSGGGSGSGTGDMPFGNMPQFNNWDIPDSQIWIVVTIIFLIALLIGALFFVLGVYGRLGLIHGTLKAEAGESITFGEVHTALMPNLGKSLLLNLFLAVAFIGVGIIFALVAVLGAVATMGIGLICLVPLACLMVPLFWFAAIWIEQANVALVVENLAVMDALRRGWNVVRANLGESIAMGLILLIGGGLAQFVISIPLLIAFAPMFAAMVAFSGDSSSAAGWGGLGIALLCVVIYLPILIAFAGVVQSYIKSAWTLTFLQLRARINPSAGEPLPESL